ncbi:alpha/beta hydrolase [Desulfovibrio mangrovi]|uniref:alpha/beta fold hydrolase n=1 Tax=Desulfovibrio mangrovi TaxID=2976983 RepID=UPI002246325B|nr:alpha/beta hydrolase [Desulfovibrio mangrovi]UZP68303.1 alpha/beta hydrolase [Desulfovibrio mangrovi]
MIPFNHADGEHLEVEGARIYFEIQGDPKATPLVFLHGGFGSIEDFSQIIPLLDQPYRLIGIDSRGQGKSTLGSSSLTYSRMQHDVETVLRHLGITQTNFIGHSDGGIVGLRLAAAHVIEIPKLVTIGSHWRLTEDDPARPLFAGITAENWKSMFPESYNTYQRLNPEPDFPMLTREIVRLWLDTSSGGYPAEEIRNITSDLMVVRGDEDILITRQHAMELADMISGACLLNVPFSSHVIHQEKPELLMDSINEFLNR